MLSLRRVLGSFWAPSTTLPHGLLLVHASLSRVRWQPLPLGEALATTLASLRSSVCRNLAQALQEMGLKSWLLLLTDPVVFVWIPSF